MEKKEKKIKERKEIDDRTWNSRGDTGRAQRNAGNTNYANSASRHRVLEKVRIKCAACSSVYIFQSQTIKL